MTKNLTQSERLAVVETKIDSVEDTLTQTNEKIDLANEKIDGLIERLDEKYASKWVEKVMAGLIGLVLTSVVGALLALVIIK